MLDTTTRKSLLRVAHAAMDFAADLSPEQEFAGHAEDLRKMAEWMDRRVGTPDARHVRRALLAVHHSLLFKNPQFATLSLRNAGAIPAAVIDAIEGLIQALANLRLDDMPNVKELTSDAIKGLRDAAERLESVASLVLTEVQLEIMDKLDGAAFTFDELEQELSRARSTIHGRPDGSGGLKELQELGYVTNDRLVGGYYRPDSPPRRRESN